MYDYEALKKSWLKFLNDFEMDTFTMTRLILPGRVLEKIDYRLEKWPGMAW